MEEEKHTTLTLNPTRINKHISLIKEVESDSSETNIYIHLN